MPPTPHHFSFFSCRSGSISVLFSVSAVLSMVSIGAALDFGRAYTARVQLQRAIDAAVLAAARKHAMNDGDVSASVVQFFEVNKPLDQHIKVLSVSGGRGGQGIFQGMATAEVRTTFMNLAGFETLSIEVGAEAAQGGSNIEVALVLDTTGSMAGTRLSSLKDSATNLVESMFNNAASSDQIKIGLVPFSQYVNVGMHNRSAPWMLTCSPSSLRS